VFSQKLKHKTAKKNAGQCLLHENKPVCEKSAIFEQNKKHPKSHLA